MLMVMLILCDAASNQSSVDFVKYVSLLISIISLVIAISTRLRTNRISRNLGRPDIKVDYDTINQTHGAGQKRYSVNIFFSNESDFKIKIKLLKLSTNGNILSDIQIAYLNDWVSTNETRSFDWLVDFAENQEMRNSLKICVEVESGEEYQIDFDLSGVNRGTAFQGKMR